MIRLVLVVFLVGCGAGTPDARLAANLYTDTCTWRGDAWLGVENLEVTLEVAPGALPVRDVPGPVGACTLDAPLFAAETPPDEGEAIPRLDGTPRWASDLANGLMQEDGPGLWLASRRPEAGCQELGDVAPSGIRLEDAGVFAGLSTPAPGAAGLVNIDGRREDEATKPVVRGNALDLSWTASGWPESFVQLRVLSQGRVRQSLTCNTTGLSAWEVDAAQWDQLDAPGVDSAQIYVGFQAVEEQKVDGFGPAEVVTRMVAMLGDNDT
jgi:hypothetical protein